MNNRYKGLIFENEIFQKLNIGDKLKGFVKNVRKDNKIDISLQPIGYDNLIVSAKELIAKKLAENDGKLNVTDKSTAEEIYTLFKISKKSFKKAIGALYKAKIITIESDHIRLLKMPEPKNKFRVTRPGDGKF